MIKRVAILLLLVAMVASKAGPSLAMTFIRDAEIEQTIHKMAAPLFEAAGLNPDAVQIHLVRDDTLNAFVAGGMNLFLHTGLLQESRNASQVIGVIAHETGHIAGGHLARQRTEMANAGAQALIATLLGAALGAASGSGELGAAAISGGTEIARRGFLAYSRTEESAADQAALRLLDRTSQTSRGLYEFLEILADQELLLSGQQDPYVRTHPITGERLAIVERHLRSENAAQADVSPEMEMAHARMVAKLDGFLKPANAALRDYAGNSMPDRYARAVAHFRVGQLDQALTLIDGLIAEYPQDPYFHELRGQMLFENGRIADALPSYDRALQLAPDSVLIKTERARAAIETGDPAQLQTAQDLLNQAVRQERDNIGFWRLLGIAYGRGGQEGEASLALAEAAYLRGERGEALMHARRALDMLPYGSSSWVQAEDVRMAAEQLDPPSERRR